MYGRLGREMPKGRPGYVNTNSRIDGAGIESNDTFQSPAGRTIFYSKTLRALLW